MVPCRVVEDLPHGPDGGALVEEDQVRAAGIRPGQQLVVLGVVAVHGVAPGIRVEAVLPVELTQRVVVLARRQLHPAEELVAHQDAERARVGAQTARRGRQHRLRGIRVRREVRVDEFLPLVEQARVDLAHQLAQPLDQVEQVLRFGVVGDGLPGGPVRIREVAQHDALAAGEFVEGHELPERHGPLVHVAHDRLRAEFEVGDPRLGFLIGGEGEVQQLF